MTMRTTPRRRFLGAAAFGALGAAALSTPADAAALAPGEEANKKVVDDFCAAWKSGDAAKVGSYVADNCIVRFTASTDGSPAVSGRAAVVEQVTKFLAGSNIEFMIKETWASGPMVVNKRVDRIVSKAGTRDIPVIGVFFLRQGKIKEWSDFIADPV